MSNVDHPKHYTALGFEVWDIVKHLDFATGNVVKYILRAPFKGRPVEDLKKALWYARHADRDQLGFINESCSEAARMIGETLENMNFDIPLEVAINNLYALIRRRYSVDEFIKNLERDVEMLELVSHKPENKED